MTKKQGHSEISLALVPANIFFLQKSTVIKSCIYLEAAQGAQKANSWLLRTSFDPTLMKPITGRSLFVEQINFGGLRNFSAPWASGGGIYLPLDFGNILLNVGLLIILVFNNKWL